MLVVSMSAMSLHTATCFQTSTTGRGALLRVHDQLGKFYQLGQNTASGSQALLHSCLATHSEYRFALGQNNFEPLTASAKPGNLPNNLLAGRATQICVCTHDQRCACADSQPHAPPLLKAVR